MPKRKSNGYKRPGYYSCGRMVLGDAGKALKLARHLKTLVNVEQKFNDTLVASTIGTTMTIDQLTNLSVGDTSSTRDGDQVKFMSIDLNYHIVINASATASEVRVILIEDKQTNGVIFTSAMLLEDDSANDALVSPLNLDNKFRFNILYDRNHQVSISGAQRVHIKKFFTVQKKVRYSLAAGNLTDIRSSSYALCLISNEGTNLPSVRRSIRLRFVDN